MNEKVEVIMDNPNTLIAMAYVSENGRNPFSTFCEYIKYCVFSNGNEQISIDELKQSLSINFGIILPFYIIVRCLSFVQSEGLIVYNKRDHLIMRKGTFDTDLIDEARKAFRETESALLNELILYVKNYKKNWSVDYAREQLVLVLNEGGIAKDIFFQKDSYTGTSFKSEEDYLWEDISDEDDEGPLYTDGFFVGKFIEKTLNEDSVTKDYLIKVCEGIMLCIGAYQLPTGDSSPSISIKGTIFIFDTRLLLRLVGCANKVAVTAVTELVNIIQKNGGKIYYFPHTFDEMTRAFESAIHQLQIGDLPKDPEMLLFASGIKAEACAVLEAKKAGLSDELRGKGIALLPLGYYDQSDLIKYGFSKDDLTFFMKSNLNWNEYAIENDATSIWETHMRRQGNYSDYFGTSQRFCVFVSNNTRLVTVALDYKSNRSEVYSIRGWKSNRLPVITDIRLFCRIWSPAHDNVNLPILMLTENAYAAQRPTRSYINRIRDLAKEYKKNNVAYSNISLPAFFDDELSDIVFEKTNGQDQNLDIGSFASSLEELQEMKAIDLRSELDEEREKHNQTRVEKNELIRALVDNAVEHNARSMGFIARILLIVANLYPSIIAILLAIIGSIISYFTSITNILLISVAGAVLFAIIGQLVARFIAQRKVYRWLLPKIERCYVRRIEKNLSSKEIEYKDEIIQQVIQKNKSMEKIIKIIK